ncbi:MAG: hypothetical protein JO246_07120 [Frankiaceae bacterium]|nr:hypothetical protein [Frankiaceae bacterium]
MRSSTGKPMKVLSDRLVAALLAVIIGSYLGFDNFAVEYVLAACAICTVPLVVMLVGSRTARAEFATGSTNARTRSRRVVLAGCLAVALVAGLTSSGVKGTPSRGRGGKYFLNVGGRHVAISRHVYFVDHHEFFRLFACVLLGVVVLLVYPRGTAEEP